jgi:hypothetical protein
MNKSHCFTPELPYTAKKRKETLRDSTNTFMRRKNSKRKSTEVYQYKVYMCTHSKLKKRKRV